MLRLFKIVSRNKLFYIFAILIIIMFPSTLYLQSSKDQTVIVTTIGIDKEGDEIKLSALAVVPKGGNDISANLEVFEGKGDTISSALEDIANSTGKDIGLAHCDCIALSISAMSDNVSKYLDYFIRAANLTTNASLIATDGKASDLLSATKSSNNLLDLSLRNIVQFKEERSLLESVNIEKFYRQYFTESSTFYMPILSTEYNNSSNGNSSSSEEGGKEESVQGEKKISGEDKVAVITKGKYQRTLSEEEAFIYSLLAPNSKYMKIVVDNINDASVNSSKETFEQVNKLVIPKYSFIDGVPTATYSVILNLRIDEVNGDNFSYASIDGLHNYLTDTVKSEIEKQVQDKLNITIEKMKSENTDILNLYTKFNAYSHNKWKDYLSTLNTPSDYLEGIDIKINLTLLNVV